MNKKEKREQLKKELDEIKDDISKLLADSTDYSEEEIKKIKEKYNKFYIDKEPNIFAKFISWFLYFLENLIVRYIFLTLILALFFKYIAFSNKYYILLIILYFDIVISLMSTTIYKIVEVKNTSYLTSNFLSLVLEIIIAILVNNNYPIFTNSLMLGLYIFVSSLVYNLCTILFSYRMFKRRLY